MRTLEMKIADAGPHDQRVNPHVLTRARAELEKGGRIKRVGEVWFHRQNEPPDRVKDRLAVLQPLYNRLADFDFKLRMGQTLEIAIYRALQEASFGFVGGYPDLDDHDDTTRYSKEEPPLRVSGRSMPGEKRFDFLGFHGTAGPLGIEAKNVREWMYPNRHEVKELLLKALAVDAVPILIARRIPYVTVRLLQTAGVMLFETYNQLYPSADAVLAADVRVKTNLGYHDVRAGNEPNQYLRKFVATTIDANADEYRHRFDRHKDLLTDFVSGDLPYAGFAARLRRREQGVDENADTSPEEEFDPNDIDPEQW
jgi:hypothetical protein